MVIAYLSVTVTQKKIIVVVIQFYLLVLLLDGFYNSIVVSF